MRPESTSVKGSEPPRNGTCCISIPAIETNISPARWYSVPIPGEG